MKRRIILSVTAILIASSLYLPGQTPSAQAQSGPYAVANVGAPAARQSIVYQEPKSNGTLLPVSEVVSRFEMLIYARSRMLSNLNTYKQAGWNGLSLLYFDIAKNNGPKGLSSLLAQRIPCSNTQKMLPVYSNTITMDTGELCRIHDAIIAKTGLDGLIVTEDWFLHKSDGSRYEVAGGGTTGAAQYRMNFANPQYQQYYVNKLLREFQAVDPAHLPSGALGLFLDNVNESWSDIQNLNGGAPPREFADKTAYQQGMLAYLAAIRSAYPAIQIWGNMTSFSTNEETFTSFKPHLDGAMIEGAFLDWDGNPRSVSKIESGNAMADQWGKSLLYVVQGDPAGTYHNYTFGLYLLMANEDAYFFFSDQSSYANYYEISEYQSALGPPLGTREKIASGIWQRLFRNGSVQVDINSHTAAISLSSNPSSTPSLAATGTIRAASMTPTHTLLPTLTLTPTRTRIPSRTPTPTRTPKPTRTPTPTRTPFVLFTPTLNPVSTNTTSATSTTGTTSTPSTNTLGEGMHDDTYSALAFSPLWISYNNAGAYGGSLHYSNTGGNTATFSFNGGGFSLFFATNINHGYLGIYVDGILLVNLSQYGTPALQKIWTSPALTEGVHTVTLRHAAGQITTVDAIQIYAGPPPAP